MWKIGDLSLDGRVVLGPMSGFTFRSYREFMRPFGIGLSTTEMVSSMAILHSNPRTLDYLDLGRDRPVAVQLFGGDLDAVERAARRVVELDPTVNMIDLNMGCPVAKVVRNGAGSAMMREPAKCGEMVRRVKRASGLPVSAKIRLGWNHDSINHMDVIRELQDAGVDAIAIHPRTRTEGYAGTPHYDLVEGLRDMMSVPLIISGNIYTLDDAVRAREVTGADAVMVARGGVGNPYLVTQIDTYLRTGERLPNPFISQQVDWCIQLMDMVLEEFGEERAMAKLRSIVPRFISGCWNCRDLRRTLSSCEVRNREAVVRILEEVDSEMGHKRVNSYARPAGCDE